LATPQETTLDHVIPRSLFSSDALANQAGNRVPACRRCNQLKGDWFLTAPNHPRWCTRDAYLALAGRVIAGRRKRNGLVPPEKIALLAL